MFEILKDVLVIELSAFVAGPLSGLILGQLGANVIRIDPTDEPIDFKRFPIDKKGNSYYWAELNKGKKSLIINYKLPEGLRAIENIVSKNKNVIFITNLELPSELSYKSLVKLNKDITYLDIKGSPNKKEVDYTISAQSGIPFINGKCNEPINNVFPSWDSIAGCLGALSVIVVFLNTKTKIKSKYIKLTLLDTCFWMLGNLGFIGEHYQKDTNREPTDNFIYGTFGKDFTTKDNIKVFVICLTLRQWTNLVDVLDLKDDIYKCEKTLKLNFKIQAHLYYARYELYEVIHNKIKTIKYKLLKNIFNDNDVLWSKYNTVNEFVNENPFCNLDNPIFSEIKHDNLNEYISADIPFNILNIPRIKNNPIQNIDNNESEINFKFKL